MKKLKVEMKSCKIVFKRKRRIPNFRKITGKKEINVYTCDFETRL